MSAEPRRTFELDLPAVHEQVMVARRSLRIFARMQSIAGRDLDTLLLVASELLSNAVDHGGGGSSMDLSEVHANSPRMRLVFSVQDHRWRLSVLDEGEGSVPELREMLHPSGVPDLEDERGRGFFLLAKMVDEVGVEPNPKGRGVCITAALTFGGHDSSAADLA